MYLSAGIRIHDGNYSWRILNNSIYQTAARAEWGFAGILVANSEGNDFIIDGNYIGGSAPLCAGTPWTISGTTYNSFLYGIYLSCSNSGISKIQNNTISNLNISMRIQADQDMSFCGILSDGRIDVTGNTIGSSTTTGSIVLYNRAGTTSSWTGWNLGIWKIGDGNVNENKIGSITINGDVSSQLGFNAIQIDGSLINDVVINGNIIQ